MFPTKDPKNTIGGLSAESVVKINKSEIGSFGIDPKTLTALEQHSKQLNK